MPETRRAFLKNSGILMAAGAVAPFRAGKSTMSAPSDTINVAAIGVNGMGWADLESLMKLPGIRPVALCDVDRNVLDRRSAQLEQMTGNMPEKYGDYRRVLDNDDVDVVVIGTPDHWHPLIMIEACQAGKDVYVEKPLANSIEECNRMVEAAAYYGRVVQVGQWQRSGPHWDDAVRFVQSGALGNIRTVKAWAYQGWMKNVPVLQDEPVPEGVDYDFWLGPAPERPFNRNRFHFNFRWFWDYAGGLMTDWGVHIVDMVLWGMDARAPKNVMASGGKFAYPDGGMETPDTLQAIYEFDGFSMIWEHAVGISNGPYGRNHGVAFIGNLGTLVADRGGWEVIPEVEDGNPKMQAVDRQPGTGRDLDLHTENFVSAIVNGGETNCPPKTAWRAAVNCHMGNVAFKVGRKVTWDDTAGKFVDDDEANALLMNAYRAPWVLPEMGRR